MYYLLILYVYSSGINANAIELIFFFFFFSYYYFQQSLTKTIHRNKH